MAGNILICGQQAASNVTGNYVDYQLPWTVLQSSVDWVKDSAGVFTAQSSGMFMVSAHCYATGAGGGHEGTDIRVEKNGVIWFASSTWDYSQSEPPANFTCCVEVVTNDELRFIFAVNKSTQTVDIPVDNASSFLRIVRIK